MSTHFPTDHFPSSAARLEAPGGHEMAQTAPLHALRSVAQPSGRSKHGAGDAGTLARRFLLGFVPVVALTAVAWPNVPRRYEASAVIVLRPADTGAGEDVQPLRQTLDENAIQSEVDRITSAKLADAVIAKHQLMSDPEFASAGVLNKIGAGLGLVTIAPVPESEVRRRLNERLGVVRDRRSYTIRMGYWSSDPAKAAAMTDTLLAAYLGGQVARKRESTARIALWMRAETDALREAYHSSVAAIETLLTKSGLVDTGEQVAIDNQLQTLSTEAAQSRARIIEATVRLDSLRGMREAGDLENAPEILASPTVRHLKENLAAALSKSAVLGRETQAINAEIKAEADRIVQAAEIELRDLRRREAMLLADIQGLRNKLVERRRNELQLEELKGRAAFAKAEHDKAITRMQVHRSRIAALTTDAEVVNTPEPPARPSYPQPLLTAAASLLLATMAGVLMAWRQLRAFIRDLSASSHPEAPPAADSRDPAPAPAIPASAILSDAPIAKALRV
jgi:polysaccharide biosynthesis transport protein